METKYQLTDAELKKAIDSFILQMLKTIEGTKRKNPQLIIITAGPGAGKTGLEIKLINETDTTPAVISSDIIAKYHPHYDEMLKELHPAERYKIKREFVTRVAPEIYSKARELGATVINDNTLDKGESDIVFVREFYDNGYSVSLNIMATDWYIAKLACFKRQATELELGQTPRGISEQTFKDKYNGFVEEISTLQNQGLCNNINVYIRGENEFEPKCVYSSDKEKESYHDFKEALDAERKKQRNRIIRDSDAFLRDIDDTKRRIEANRNNAPQILIDDIINGLNKLKEEFEQELRRDISK